MNESFLQLSVQLQKRAQMITQLKERENSAGNHSVVISWNITHYIYNYIIQRMNWHGNLLLRLINYALLPTNVDMLRYFVWLPRCSCCIVHLLLFSLDLGEKCVNQYAWVWWWVVLLPDTVRMNPFISFNKHHLQNILCHISFYRGQHQQACQAWVVMEQSCWNWRGGMYHSASMSSKSH